MFQSIQKAVSRLVTAAMPLGVIAAVCLCSQLSAQVAGTITGLVQDPAGAAIAAAKIEIYLPGGSKPVIASKTTADGLFTISNVRPETYEIKVVAPGFTTYALNNVQVDPARETTLPTIKLQVGNVATTVDVTSNSEGVQTSNVETSTTVSIAQVSNLPVVNRSPLTLIGTQAGVLTTGSDTTTINGQRSSFTNITLNGVNIQDNFIRTNDLDFLPNLLLSSQVAEFSVSTSNEDASQSAASSVTFISPTGSNSLHGSAIWANRNNYFAANTWFNNQSGIKRPFLNQNQFAGTIAGHILKDKWFYYAAYEAFRLRQQTAYSFLGRNDRTRDNVTGTTDYIISSRQQLSGSYNWNRDLLDRPDQQNNYVLVPNVSNSDFVKFFSAAYRFAPTPTITNELRGGANFAPAVFDTNQQFGSAIVTGYIFNNPVNTFRAQGRNTNTYNINDNATWVKGKHFVKFGASYQSIRIAPYNDAGLTPTYTIGFGAGHQGLVAGQFPTGISASDLATANSLLASLEGAVTSASQTFNITSQTSGYVNGATNLRHYVYDNYGFYIQDNWKVLRNLTIEAGLRYEYYTPLRETNNLEIAVQIQNNDVAGTLLNPNSTSTTK